MFLDMAHKKKEHTWTKIVGKGGVSVTSFFFFSPGLQFVS